MTIRYPDINPYDFYDAEELSTDGTYVYLTTTVVSTVAPNIVNVGLASDGEGILYSRDHPVRAANLTASTLGDFADLSGTSGGAADGTYQVATVVSDTQFTVVGTVANSTGGSVNFRYPAGANSIGFSLTGAVHITHDEVQGALHDLDLAISSSSGLVTGTAIVDFGAFPGSSDTTIVITGQTGILSTSVIQAWILPIATVDHSVDEHRVEEIQADADTIVPGVGFTIFARTRNDLIYGQWTVGWLWH